MSQKLWNHQEYSLNKYKNREYFGLLFPTGTGKTATAIAIAEEKDMPVLIIAPNALCCQWEEELHKEDNCNKEWETLVCTSTTKNTVKFKKSFEKMCKEK